MWTVSTQFTRWPSTTIPRQTYASLVMVHTRRRTHTHTYTFSHFRIHIHMHIHIHVQVYSHKSPPTAFVERTDGWQLKTVLGTFLLATVRFVFAMALLLFRHTRRRLPTKICFGDHFVGNRQIYLRNGIIMFMTHTPTVAK